MGNHRLMNGLSLSASHLLDRALAALTPAAKGNAAAVLPIEAGASPVPRVTFEQWMAGEASLDRPSRQDAAHRHLLDGETAEETATGEQAEQKSARKAKRELNPAEHPLLAPYMPVADPVDPAVKNTELSSGTTVPVSRTGSTAAETVVAKTPAETVAPLPVAGAEEGAEMPQPTASGRPVPSAIAEAVAVPQEAGSTDAPSMPWLRRAAGASAPESAPAPNNARPEYIPVHPALRAVQRPDISAANPNERSAATPDITVGSEVAAGSPLIRQVMGARAEASQGAPTMPEQARKHVMPGEAVRMVAPGRAVTSEASGITVIADQQQTAPIDTAQPDIRADVAETPVLPIARKTAEAPGHLAGAARDRAIPVDTAAKQPDTARDSDSRIGDPSAFGLDAVAKGDASADGFGGQSGHQNGSAQQGQANGVGGVTASAAAHAAGLGRAVLDFSQGLAWIDRLATDIAAMGSKDGELSFEMTPDNLGQLTVSMKKDETGIKLAFHTVSHEAANILAASQTQLKQELSNAGLQLGSFDIGHQAASYGDRNGGSAARAGAGNGSDDRNADMAGDMASEAPSILGGQSDPNARYA